MGKNIPKVSQRKGSQLESRIVRITESQKAEYVLQSPETI
jgi:hypothetical protein